MSKEREVLKLARDVLLPYKSTGLRWYTDVDEALDAIEEVLAQREHSCVACEGNPKGNNNPCSVCGTTQPEQKPVGVVALDTSRPFVGGSYNGQVMPWSQAPTVKTVVMFKDLPLNTPLYTTQPQRKMPTPREVKDVLRSTGLLTNMQSWEVAKEVMKLLAAHGIEEKNK